MITTELKDALFKVILSYRKKFSSKTFDSTVKDSDILMDIFSITPADKLKNMQYWSRELGACWERLVHLMCKALKIVTFI